MIDFANVKSIIAPKGEVEQIARGDEILWKKEGNGDLPAGYTPLAYITIPSQAWFNTSIVPSGDKWTYETEIYATSWGSNGYYYLAVRQTKDYSTMYSPLYVQSGWRMYLSGSKTASAGGAKNTWYTIRSELENGLQKMYINGELKTTTNLAITTNYTLPLYLFAANFHGGMYQGVEGRMKYLKVSNNGMLVANFVSAKRNSDGVCGLFDLVGQKFYTNAGSGTVTGTPL